MTLEEIVADITAAAEAGEKLRADAAAQRKALEALDARLTAWLADLDRILKAVEEINRSPFKALRHGVTVPRRGRGR